AVDDAAPLGRVAPEPLPQPRADVRVRLGGLRRRRVPARADRPDRLVGDDEARNLIAGEPVEPNLDLTIEDGERLVALALVERLADADDRNELGAERGGDLAVHELVGLVEISAPLGMADDHVFGPRLLEHRRADFAGERALALPMQILRGNRDVRVAGGLGHRMKSSERRGHHDLDVGDVLHEAAQLLDEDHRLLNGLEHLPVAGDEWNSQRSRTPRSRTRPSGRSMRPSWQA